MLIELVNGPARASIATEGAELHAWQVAGADLLWSRAPSWWEKSSPILFPIVGWANQGLIRADGLARPMGVHGFAAASAFALEARTAASATFVLRDTAATRAIYPYAFRLAVTYQLEPDRICATFVLRNPGPRALPYALGLHPAFRWPLAEQPRDEHAIIFAEAEAPEVPVIAPGGLFSQARRPVPLDGRRLRLNDALFAADALCFLNARSSAFRFTAGAAGPSITLEARDFPHLALWSKPGAPFVSMEVWTGYGDPVGYDGELADKPGMRQLAADAEASHAVDFIYHGGDRT